MTSYGYGVGTPITGVPVGTVITETEYRRMSGDTRSPWSSTGDVAGAEFFASIAEMQVGDYLGTFLRQTEVEDEEHYIDIQYRYRMGLVRDTRMHVDTFRVRLVPNETITVTFLPRESTNSSSAQTGSWVVGHKIGRIDVSPCLDNINFSYYRSDVICVTYTAGYWGAALPYNVKLGTALIARQLARELIAKSGFVIDDDYPHFSFARVLNEMGVSRSFMARDGVSFFGDTPLHQYVESILAPYQIKKSQGIR